MCVCMHICMSESMQACMHVHRGMEGGMEDATAENLDMSWLRLM